MATATPKKTPEKTPAPAAPAAAPKPATRTPRPRLSLVNTQPAAPAFPETEAAASALGVSRAATFLCDPEFTIVYANDRSRELLAFMEPNLHKHSESWRSFRVAEVVGLPLSFLFADEPLEYRRATDPRSLPYAGRIKTGPCVCDVQVSALKDDAGNTLGYSVDWDRITDRLAQERRIRQLMVTLEHSTSNTFLCDLDWNVLYANEKAKEVMAFMEPNLHRHSDHWKSFRAAEVVGKSLEWLFTDEPEHYRKASDPRSHPYHCVIRTGPCVCDVTVTSTKDEGGAVTGYAVYWERITDKVAQEARADQLMQVLENSSANTLLCDLNWNVLYANKKSFEVLAFMEPNLHRHDARWHSFRAKDIVGKSLDWLFTDEPEQFRRVSDPRTHPYRANIKTGPCTCDVSVTSTTNDKGEPTGYAVYWERITEKLQMEAQAQAQIAEGQYLAAKIEEMQAAALAVTQGDLTQTIPVDRDDAVGRLAGALNDMVANLSQLVAQVQVASGSIVDSSSELASGSDDLSRRTEEQASSLEETASSMEEMTSTVKQNADNARQANQLAAQARDVAEKGGAVVSHAVSSMEEINKASKRIADIISVIDEIAFQTNLLALNAAVEAARVGEQGRGFAVVATEVRNLAGRSATAAKEIKALVQDSVQKVQEGSSLVNQSGQQLDEIVGSVKKVADIISEISAASQEQSAGIEQVNKAIIQMDQITQQNAALVEEATASSQAMTEQARELQTLVSRFQIDDAYLEEAAQQTPPPAKAVPAKPAPRTPAGRPALGRAAAPLRAAARPAFRHGGDDGFEEF